MLGFRAVASDYSIVNPDLVPGPVIAAGNLVFFTLESVSNTNYALFNTGTLAGANNSVVRGVSHISANFKTVNTAFTGFSFATSSAGSHAATIGGAGSRNTATTSPVYANFTATSGSHSHSITGNIFANTLPAHVRVGAYVANNANVSFIPPKTIVFAANVTVNLTRIQANNNLDNLHIAISNNNLGVQNTNIEYYNTNIISSSGDHSHVTGGATFRFTSGSPNSTESQQQTTTAHTHFSANSINIVANAKTNRVKLRTWVTTDYCPISNGMIFAWTTNNVPTGWYSCNGQTINGYTTPNLVDRYVECGNSSPSSHNVITSGGNQMAWSSGNTNTDNWTHEHWVGSQFNIIGTSRSVYHTSASFPHFHTIAANNGVNWAPRTTNLGFYIYLP